MDQCSVKISSMGIEDLDDIMSIENTSFSLPWTRNMFLQELHLPISRNIVAKTSENSLSGNSIAEIAGYMTCWLIAGEMHVQRIATRKNLRESGIASKMMEEMIRRCAKEGCTWCTLEVGRSNESARNLYEKYGFTIQGVRPLYYVERNEDALIMGADMSKCMRIIGNE
jgi:[ribosomal protein S18]-alanine N-acetyltransferase